MNQCTVPGCGGTVEDGYCVVCGMAATANPDPAASAGPAPAPGACSQPGCSGTIADGYCDVCGSAAAAPAASPAAASAPASPSQCTQSGCAGTIVDGYCDVCGMPPSVKSAGTPASAAGSSGSAHSGSAFTGSGYTGSGRTGSTRTGSSRSSGRRGMLGAGLVEVPRVPYRDPSTAVLSDPQVAENRRYCSNCGEPVGRSRDGRPGRTEGFCAKCRTAFSFTPKLAAGDLVGGQYEVLGCIAHGGLGWIYLALDRNVNDRWVVLKGLLDTGDADALAAATAERAYLAEVEHPNIVKIYNFVQHGGAGYIVMEYVGGASLKDILQQRRSATGEQSLPVAQAIAYALEVLQAFGYLHAQGLVYCDFKPDNVIQSEEQLRLIDLGGVRRLDDQDGAIYGTVGYQAPEIADDGPSIGSDLYTVGRALAVLSFPFKGYTSTWADSLPPAADVPVLARFPSYDRLLRRATHKDPARRFQDAAEMAEQLTGVLREVLAAEDGEQRPAPSGLFGQERAVPGITTERLIDRADVLPRVLRAEAAVSLPVPLVSGGDPAAGFLAGLTALEPARMADALATAPQQTPEVRLALARVRIELGAYDEARLLLDAFEADSPGDWRTAWYRALATLAEGRPDEAAPLFDDLYALLPGEAAPKLALAYCLELSAPREAAALYETVWRTDRQYIGAAFGLARVHLDAGDRAAATAALDSVPSTSIHYHAAQVAAIAAAVRGRSPGDVTAAELARAGERLETLRLEGDRHDRLAAEVFEAALDWVEHTSGAQGGTVLGAPLLDTPLRVRLEATYRSLARRATDREDRRWFVDCANAVRPRTLL
ncbi:tetratricopeptide repeat protein [Spirillospora sp. NPDC029432]|uniref:tetratricopeptide repeat protein n=1 Tax=Spirillospora sp. NPDC029432 TaxID=3154599 RepID=UPI003456C4C5